MWASEREQRAARLVAKLATLAAVLVLVVIASSAWLRLMESGLGCSGWPACYGATVEPNDATPSASARKATHLDPVRGAHRVAASAVGFLIGITVLLWLSGGRWRCGATGTVLAVLALTAFLAVLGRYTPGVRLPAVTLGNMLGGMALLALLWLLRLQLAAPAPATVSRLLSGAAWLLLLLVTAQLLLGGLVSSQYAALACVTFPDCNGVWWPPHWSWAAFDPRRSFDALGADAAPAMREVLHIAHRCAAALVACGVVLLAIAAWCQGGALRLYGVAAAGLLLLEIALGVALIVAPPLLALTVAHDVIAALLLAAVTGIAYRMRAA